MKFLVIAAVAAVALPVGAFDCFMNGIPYRSYSDSELDAMSSAVPGADGQRVTGVPLGEILPLVGDAWKMEASSASAKVEWNVDDLGERLFSIFLTRDSGGNLNLQFNGRSIRNPVRIDVRADLLEEDGLEFWVGWEGIREMKAEVAKFASARGKTVRITEVPDTRTKLLALSRAGGKLPDLAMVQSDYIPALASEGILQAVDYLVDDDILRSGYEAFLSDGRFWAVPLYLDVQLVFYRPSVVGGILPPGYTLEELESRAGKLKGRIDAPLCWNAYSAYWLLPFIAGFGNGSVVDGGGNLAVEDRPGRLALEKLLELKKNGLLVPLERDAMTSRFVAGKAGYILSASYDIPMFREIGLDFAVAPYPTIASTGKPLAPLLDFKGLAICRRTGKPILARRLIQYLTGTGFQARFTSRFSKIPVNRKTTAVSGSNTPYDEQFSKSIEIGLVVPPSRSYGIYRNVMWKLLGFCLDGRMSPEETLSTAARLMEENLKAE